MEWFALSLAVGTLVVISIAFVAWLGMAVLAWVDTLLGGIV